MKHKLSCTYRSKLAQMCVMTLPVRWIFCMVCPTLIWRDISNQNCHPSACPCTVQPFAFLKHFRARWQFCFWLTSCQRRSWRLWRTSPRFGQLQRKEKPAPLWSPMLPWRNASLSRMSGIQVCRPSFERKGLTSVCQFKASSLCVLGLCSVVCRKMAFSSTGEARPVPIVALGVSNLCASSKTERFGRTSAQPSFAENMFSHMTSIPFSIMDVGPATLPWGIKQLFYAVRLRAYQQPQLPSSWAWITSPSRASTTTLRLLAAVMSSRNRRKSTSEPDTNGVMLRRMKLISARKLTYSTKGPSGSSGVALSSGASLAPWFSSASLQRLPLCTRQVQAQSPSEIGNPLLISSWRIVMWSCILMVPRPTRWNCPAWCMTT